MAFHFRKLKQSLRLIPSTKTIGFTRVNEGDQSKSPCSERSSSDVSSGKDIDDRLNNWSWCLGISDRGFPDSPTVSMSQSNPDSLHQIVPAASTASAVLPLTHRDLVQLLCTKPGGNVNFDPRANEDYQLPPIKYVQLTSDDILIQPNACDLGNDVITNITSTEEKIPMDVLTYNHNRLLREAKPAHHFGLRPELQDVERMVLSEETFSSENQKPPSDSCFFCSSAGGSGERSNDKDGPTSQQLHDIRERLEGAVCTLFRGRHDYGIMHKNVVLENNLFGGNKVCRGVTAYALELMKLRLRIHAQYSSTGMEILNVSTLEQRGVIRIHWRLKGLPQVQMLKFWRLFQSRDEISKDDWEWFEAFSYFHIGKDGLVHKHRIDRMLPDNEKEPDKLSLKLQNLLNPAKPLVN